jgi:Bacterial Ig-like domain
MRPRLPRSPFVALLAFTVLLTVAGGASLAAFRSTTSNPGNSFAAAADYRAPTVSTTVIAKTTGYDAGYVKQGGTYYVYANVSDTGNPASGISSVTADVSAVTTGSTAVTVTAGSYSAQGTTYNYRSASLTASNPLAAGSKSYSITSTDAAGNSRTQTAFPVTVDNTAPTASDVQTANGAATAAKPELGDTVTYSFSEPIDPQSILAGWTGASTNVVVRINNTTPDTLLVYNSANTTQLPLGSVNLAGSNYVGANRTFGASGTASTMVRSGSAITVTLGTASGATLTETTNGTMTWTPSTSTYDRAGNAGTATAATESGAADKEF